MLENVYDFCGLMLKYQKLRINDSNKQVQGSPLKSIGF